MLILDWNNYMYVTESVSILYSRKLLREKDFTNFTVWEPPSKVFFTRENLGMPHHIITVYMIDLAFCESFHHKMLTSYWSMKVFWVPWMFPLYDISPSPPTNMYTHTHCIASRIHDIHTVANIIGLSMHASHTMLADHKYMYAHIIKLCALYYMYVQIPRVLHVI